MWLSHDCHVFFRYGEQAGKVADDSLATAGHTVDLASVSQRAVLTYLLLMLININD